MSPRQEFHPLQAQEVASGRQKDLLDLPLLESFRAEYEKSHTPRLRSAADIAGAQ